MSNEDKALADEWARMQGVGRGLAKQRAVATIASTAVASLGFLGALVLYLLWPFDRIPIYFLLAPIAGGVAAGLAVRKKLWPKGQFA